MKLDRCALATMLAFAAACGGDEGAGPDRADTNTADVRGGTTDASSDVASVPDVAAPDVAPDVVVPDAATGCVIGDQRCDGPGATFVCIEGGAEERRSCDPETTCIEETGVCTPEACPPRTRECVTAATYRVCGGDGQAWGETEMCAADTVCADGACVPGGCIARVMFAVDGSGSMSGEWDTVQRSIAEVVDANPGVAFGLSMFPTGLGCTIGNGVGDFFSPGVDWPHVEIQEDAGGVLADWFATNDIANGSTPLISTIEWFGDNARAVWGDDRRGAYLVVLSEGADTCRCDDGDSRCLVDGLSAATYDLLTAGVKTYVIGYQYGDAPGALEAIAANGGTLLSAPVLAGNETGLIEAFGAILSDAKACP